MSNQHQPDMCNEMAALVSRRAVLAGSLISTIAGGAAVAAATRAHAESVTQPAGTRVDASSRRRTPAAVDPRSGYIVTPKGKVQHAPRIIAWYPIGNSSPDDKDRRIGWNLKKEGWQGFVDRYALPVMSGGFDAIQLHNPGGTRAKEEMMADQFITAKESGQRWILQEFVDAWKPVTKRIPVIAYMGMLPKNPRLLALLNRKDYFGFLVNIAAAYRLPLEAGMEIAFDALHDVKEGSWELNVYRLLTAMGVRTYVETAPNASDIPLFNANFQIVNTTLERTLKNAEPWMAPLEQLSGERIILLNNLPQGKKWEDEPDWVPQWMAHWINQGWTVAVSPTWMLKTKVRPWDAVQPHLDRLREGRP
ncbi:MAG: hypothetical protein KGS45_12070 [Planctomycetes bacterium]|nr:hypothetical protein [Planctomycetota bacterium]